MFFWFKKDKIVLDAYVSDRYAYANKFSPIKSCDTFSQIYNNKVNVGFIMPLWCDLCIKWNHQKYQYKFSNYLQDLKEHSNKQLFPLYNDYWLLKLESPWLFDSGKNNIKVVVNYPFFYYKELPKFVTPSGIIETRNGMFASNIFLFLNKNVADEIFLSLNDPISHFIPITDKEVIIKTHLVSVKEHNILESKFNPNTVFTNKHYSLQRYYKKR